MLLYQYTSYLSPLAALPFSFQPRSICGHRYRHSYGLLYETPASAIQQELRESLPALSLVWLESVAGGEGKRL